MKKCQVWKCQRCGHETLSEPGEQVLAEFLCLEGRRKDGHGACLGLVRRLLGVAKPVPETEGKQP